MAENQIITGIIIAGGKSTRMKTDKTLIEFNGKKLIEYSIDLMKTVSDEIVISANDNKYAEFGCPVVADNFPGFGPMSGLEAALRYSKTRKNIVVPCDTAFVNAGLYEMLLSFAGRYDAVVPLLADGKTETLTAFYSKDILPVIVQQIKKHDYKMQNLLKALNTKYMMINVSHIVNNINTKNDLKRLKQKM